MFQKVASHPYLALYQAGFALIAFKLLIASSYLAINFVPPVPITAQTLVVLCIGYVMGARWAAVILALYLISGGLGLPVFANGKAGWSVFQSASGGYLIGFWISAVAIGILRRHTVISFFPALALMLIGTALILLIGGGWLAYLKGTTIALKKGVIPFLPGGLLKAIIGAAIGPFLREKFKLLQID